MATKIKGGGARKYGRNKKTCEMYRNQQQRERNKAAKLIKHIRLCPWDTCAREALENLPVSFRKGADLPALTDSPATTRAFDGITLTKQKQRFSEAA